MFHHVLNVQRNRGRKLARSAARTEEESTRHQRLTEIDIAALAHDFHQWRDGAAKKSFSTSKRRVEIFLEFLSSGGFYRKTAKAEGVSKASVIFATRNVVNYFMERAQNFVSLPDPAEFARLEQVVVDENERNRNAILFIDGAILPIQRPDEAGDAFYCGRNGKHRDSLNVQVVCDRFGDIRHVSSGIPGSAHDANAATWSPAFLRFLDNLPEPYCVIGDAGYTGVHEKIVCPFRGQNLGARRLQFNEDISKIRQVVERTIGALQNKWRILQLKESRLPAKNGVEFAAQCVVAACVLHNRFTNNI